MPLFRHQLAVFNACSLNPDCRCQLASVFCSAGDCSMKALTSLLHRMKMTKPQVCAFVYRRGGSNENTYLLPVRPLQVIGVVGSAPKHPVPHLELYQGLSPILPMRSIFCQITVCQSSSTWGPSMPPITLLRYRCRVIQVCGLWLPFDDAHANHSWWPLGKSHAVHQSLIVLTECSSASSLSSLQQTSMRGVLRSAGQLQACYHCQTVMHNIFSG